MKPVLLILAMLMLVPFAAAEFYADVRIIIQDNGDIEISGISNHPALEEQISSAYTSKDGSHWLLNITLDEPFDEYVFEVTFPDDAVINYLKVPTILSMKEDSGVIIKGAGKDRPFSIIAQYSIVPVLKSRIYWFILSGVFIILLVIYIPRRVTKKSMAMEALTPRQKQIIDILSGNNGKISQSELQRKIDIPKASLSRNIDALIRRGAIVKEPMGMTNMLFIRKERKEGDDQAQKGPHTRYFK